MIFPHGLMFHHFHGAGHSAVDGSISGEDFAGIIDYVGRDNILDAKLWYERYLANDLSGVECCITFDDNLRCQYDVALPVLDNYGLTAMWFICSAPLGGQIIQVEKYRYYQTVCFPNSAAFHAHFFARLADSRFAGLYRDGMSEFDPNTYLAQYSFYSDSDRAYRFVRDKVLKQERYCAFMDELVAESGLDDDQLISRLWMDRTAVRRLAAEGHVIGLHSHSHPTALVDVPVADQRREYETNKNLLEEIIDFPVTTVAHPNNSYDDDTLVLLEELGVTLGFCSNMDAARFASPMQVPRQDHAHIVNAMKQGRASYGAQLSS